MYSLKLIGFDSYEVGLSMDELFNFAIGALVIVFILLLYYQKISKNTSSKNRPEEAKPIYAYKDVLLQQKSAEEHHFPTTTKVSLTLKVIAISLILLIIITPLYKLLNVEHFV